MKIRNGFVSNSSSSSFMIALERKPKSVNDLRELLQLREDHYLGPGYNTDINQNDVLEHIYNKITKPATNTQAAEFIARAIEDKLSWEAYEKYGIDALLTLSIKASAPRISEALNPKIKDRRMIESIPSFIAKLGFDQFIFLNYKRFIFELSDNDSSTGSEAEHGNWFVHVPHIKISNH